METNSKSLTEMMGDITRFQNLKDFEKEKEKMQGVRQGLMDGLSIDLDLDEKLRKIYMQYPLEEIRRMDEARFDSIFVIDGAPVRFGKKRNFEATRDSICYFYEMDIAGENIDKAIAELDKTFEESRKEMESIFAEMGSYNNIIREAMVRDIEKQEGEMKENIIEMLRWYDDALLLNEYETYVRTLSTPERWKKLFYDMNASKGLIGRFERKSKKFHSPIHGENINRYFMLEYKFLPEKYHICTNLFLFTWIRYISYLDERKEDRFKRLYAMRIALYIKQLMNGTLEKENQEIFLQSIQRILDILLIDGYKENRTIERYLALQKGIGVDSEDEQEIIEDEQ